MTLAFDVAARRQYRVPRPWLGTLRRDVGPVAVRAGAHPVRRVPGVVRAVVRLGDRRSNRHEVGQSIGPDGVLPMPDAMRSLWHYTYGAYKFHSGLTNAAGNHHPWESKPWTWPMSLRPVLYAIDQENVPGCGAQSCVKAVMLVGTPAMWFIAVPVLAWAVWRAFVKRDWRYAAVLVGYSAGFLPWFADIDRQMYFFYAATMAPFLVMMIALILGDILHKPNQNAERRTLGLIVGELLCRARHHELRVDVPDPDGHPDLAVDVEHADLAALLALGSGSSAPNFAPRVVSRRYPQP